VASAQRASKLPERDRRSSAAHRLSPRKTEALYLADCFCEGTPSIFVALRASARIRWSARSVRSQYWCSLLQMWPLWRGAVPAHRTRNSQREATGRRSPSSDRWPYRESSSRGAFPQWWFPVDMLEVSVPENRVEAVFRLRLARVPLNLQSPRR